MAAGQTAGARRGTARARLPCRCARGLAGVKQARGRISGAPREPGRVQSRPTRPQGSSIAGAWARSSPAEEAPKVRLWWLVQKGRGRRQRAWRGVGDDARGQVHALFFSFETSVGKVPEGDRSVVCSDAGGWDSRCWRHSYTATLLCVTSHIAHWLPAAQGRFSAQMTVVSLIMPGIIGRWVVCAESLIVVSGGPSICRQMEQRCQLVWRRRGRPRERSRVACVRTMGG